MSLWTARRRRGDVPASDPVGPFGAGSGQRDRGQGDSEYGTWPGAQPFETVPGVTQLPPADPAVRAHIMHPRRGRAVVIAWGLRPRTVSPGSRSLEY